LESFIKTSAAMFGLCSAKLGRFTLESIRHSKIFDKSGKNESSRSVSESLRFEVKDFSKRSKTDLKLNPSCSLSPNN
jgi:hypothetical protein